MSDESTDEDAELVRKLHGLAQTPGLTEEEAKTIRLATVAYQALANNDRILAGLDRSMQQTERAIRVAEQQKQRADDERQRAENAERRLRQYAALDTYRRRHARNPKITLRKVCEDLGVNYTNVRALRSRTAKRKKAAQSSHTRVLPSGTTKRKRADH